VPEQQLLELRLRVGAAEGARRRRG
jgi:hypothetical protein